MKGSQNGPSRTASHLLVEVVGRRERNPTVSLDGLGVTRLFLLSENDAINGSRGCGRGAGEDAIENGGSADQRLESTQPGRSAGPPPQKTLTSTV